MSWRRAEQGVCGPVLMAPLCAPGSGAVDSPQTLAVGVTVVLGPRHGPLQGRAPSTAPLLY